MDRRRRCSSLLHHAFSTDAFWKKERCKHCYKHQLHASCLLVQSLSTKAFQGEPVYLQNDIHQAPEGLREAVRTFAFFFYERFFTSTSDHIKKKGTINSVENAGRIILIQSELPVSWIRKLNKTSIAFTAYLVENMLWSPKKFVWPHYACGIIITRSFEKINDKRANTAPRLRLL